ncbi:MAG TPA: thiamine phosphate synthase [Ruminococcus sp.]|nr:thiamine phosphate synthase [Ruminococcus sp.]
MNVKREQLLLYAVTDRKCMGSRDFYKCIEEALAGGVTMLQLREKSMTSEQLAEEAYKVGRICREYGVPLIIDDDYDAALAAGADGVHVGIEDAPVREIRRIAGKDFIIGATAKTVEQAKRAQSEGADYLGVGAVFPSPTKTNAIRITTSQLREICGSVGIPSVAIGGINALNLTELAGGGMAGIAAVSAVFGAEDIEAAAAQLREAASGLTRGEGV